MYTKTQQAVVCNSIVQVRYEFAWPVRYFLCPQQVTIIDFNASEASNWLVQA